LIWINDNPACVGDFGGGLRVGTAPITMAT